MWVFSFRTLAACCNFGLQPGCRFSCHCASGADCNSLTGECGESGGCEIVPPNTNYIETGWTGPGCQTGKGGRLRCRRDSNSGDTPGVTPPECLTGNTTGCLKGKSNKDGNFREVTVTILEYQTGICDTGCQTAKCDRATISHRLRWHCLDVRQVTMTGGPAYEIAAQPGIQVA